MSYSLYHNISELLTLIPAAEKLAKGKMSVVDLGIINDGAIVTFKGQIEWVGPLKKIPHF